MEEAFNNISMHLHNKNILKYAQITRNGTEYKITYIESHSTKHVKSQQKILSNRS